MRPSSSTTTPKPFPDYTVSDKIFRAAHRGRRDEHHRYGAPLWGHRVAGQADRHQSGRPGFRSWACPSSARTWRPSSARRTATFEKDHAPPEYPPAGGCAVTKIEDGVAAAARIGYPVLVRPSYVLGSRAMQIVYDELALRHYRNLPVLVSGSARAGRSLHQRQRTGSGHGVRWEDVYIPGIITAMERTEACTRAIPSACTAFSERARAGKPFWITTTVRLGLGIGIRPGRTTFSSSSMKTTGCT